MIGVIDYGMGNLRSVRNALEMLGAEVKICAVPEDLEDVERIYLPGVGAFRDCMANLKQRGFAQALEGAVLRQGKPIIGVCLGMQAMARKSFEGGEYEGLGWIDADVVRLEPNDPSLRVPQIGWNEVNYRHDSPFFAGLSPAPNFYFVHSYYLEVNDPALVDATCDYGNIVTAAIRKNNIFATQFHPEKSQDNGLRLIANFLQWNP
jgi:glutamine amidotransferase